MLRDCDAEIEELPDGVANCECEAEELGLVESEEVTLGVAVMLWLGEGAPEGLCDGLESCVGVPLAVAA